MRSAHRAGWALPLALLLTLAAGVRAQPTVQGPLDRLVVPGDFVTLVFRVSLPAGAAAAEIPLEVDVEAGWGIVRPPEPIALEPGGERFVPITVEVPAEAAAGLETQVALRSGAAEATVRLTVATLRVLELTAPELVVLGGDPLIVRVRNTGNVALQARLELRLDGTPVEATELELAGGGEQTVLLRPVATGFHQILLYGLDEPLRRSVEVIRFGVPDPDPVQLSGRVSGRVAGSPTSVDPALEFELAGPLSDFTTVEIEASTSTADGHAELVYLDPGREREGIEERWELRLGDLGASPFGLSLPDALGVRLLGPDDEWQTVFSAGWSDAGSASLWLASERLREAGGDDSDEERAWSDEIAFALGTDRGALDARLRARFEDDATVLSGSAALRIGPDGSELSLGFDATQERADPATNLRAELDLVRLFGDDPQLSVGGRGRTPTGDEVYGSLRLGLGDGSTSWRLGTVQSVPNAVPGRLRQLLQVGAPLSYAELRHDIALDSGWQAQSGIGVRFETTGSAGTPPIGGPAELLLRSSWVRSDGPDNGFQASGELRWRPADGRIGGRVGARLDRVLGPTDVALRGGWDLDLGEIELLAEAGLELNAWRVDLETGLSWTTGSAAPDWRASLAAGWRFDLAVPPRLVETAGGRRLGTLRLVLRIDDEALPGVVVRAGRYRLVTDADGVAEARLEPGPVDLRLELGTLPVVYALDGPAEQRVEVRLQQTTEVAFPLLRTAGLSGRVLLDRDADGVADTPASGAETTVLLRDARGVSRTLRSDASGTFAARGLLPGEIELILTDRPFGSTLVGPSRLRLQLNAGEVTAAEFLLRPAEAVARSFGGDVPRIGRIALQAERAPPGAAPWIEVALRGDPAGATVVLRTEDGERALEPRGEIWFGRLQLPSDAGAGVLGFEVEVRLGEETRSRRGQLVIDPQVPLARFEADGPVAPGGSSELAAEVLADAVAVVVGSPFAGGGEIALVESGPGRWTGSLPVPEEAADDVYPVNAEVRFDDGRTLPVEARLRVLR